jgi:hypothetical protein
MTQHCAGMCYFSIERKAWFALPLAHNPPSVLKNFGCSGLEYSDWVLQRVKEIHCAVGVSCVGYEE